MKTISIYNPLDNEIRTLPLIDAEALMRKANSTWTTKLPAPPDWEFEVPKYRVMRDVWPEANPRFRLERPHSGTNLSVWQYAERPYKAGEIVETKNWPAADFFPLNYSAEMVLDFFRTRMRSRLQQSPWFQGRVRLEDGLDAPLPTIGQVRTLNMPKFDASPARPRSAPQPVRVAR
jgi:hypothetical protein